MEAREIDAGKHQAQVERLRTTPSDDEMWTKLAELAVHIGASDEHDIEAIRMMGVALGYRRRHHEYERLSTSRRGDKAAARSEAIAWIKSSVLRLSGKSPLDPRIAKSDIDHIIALCDVVFKTTTKTAISERSVRRATTKEERLNRRFPEKKSAVA